MCSTGWKSAIGVACVISLTLIVHGACGGSARTGPSFKSDSRINFVVIIADDVSWDDIGAFGHPTIRTPNLDLLARTGERFTQAFLTTSSCSPARCSILTGRYPHSTG